MVAVLTGEEALAHVNPMPAFCAEPVPQHAITVERVRFPGEAVAAVAATDRYIAEDACALIQVEYELLPPVVDPVAAMAADAPRVHETLEGNVVFHRSLDFGDVDGDFARAEHVVRRTARWHRMGAQPIETAGAVCSFDPYRQDMTVWSNSNFYNFLPWAFAGMLGVPNNRLPHDPLRGRGQLRQQALHQQGDRRSPGPSSKARRATGPVRRGPDRTTSPPTTTSAATASTTPSSRCRPTARCSG